MDAGYAGASPLYPRYIRAGREALASRRHLARHLARRWTGSASPATVKSDASGHEFCSFDSIDQHAFGLECANVVLSLDKFSFDVPIVSGHWNGKIFAGGKTLSGLWTQGGVFLNLELARQSTALGPAPIAYDPALPPIDAAGLKAILDRDLANALEHGILAAGTGTGVSIGIVDHGACRIFTYGTAKPDSLIEIGSLTKTFTGLILAQMVEQGKVKYDEPVRELLPAGVLAKSTGPEITLLDLAIQHSGLPRMPDNFKPADLANPYADYRPTDLYAFLVQHGLEKPANSPFLYSNLGMGLLGQALANRAGITYPELIKQQITGPLGLKDTVVALSPEQASRFLQGHDAEHREVHAWDFDALAGAGGIRSTADDMLTYLEVQLHPEKLSPNNTEGATLFAALAQSHEVRADAAPGRRIALGWMFNRGTETYSHNGATGGFSSYAFFNRKGDYAAIILVNVSRNRNTSFADVLGEHIAARVAGRPAISLQN
jgi:serine-type D-Ala-D-Ala carboxypeptidase/endopeptidase